MPFERISRLLFLNLFSSIPDLYAMSRFSLSCAVPQSALNSKPRRWSRLIGITLKHDCNGNEFLPHFMENKERKKLVKYRKRVEFSDNKACYGFLWLKLPKLFLEYLLTNFKCSRFVVGTSIHGFSIGWVCKNFLENNNSTSQSVCKYTPLYIVHHSKTSYFMNATLPYAKSRAQRRKWWP